MGHIDGRSGGIIMDGVDYSMKLGDGRGWHIIGRHELRPWTDKFAAIMQLQACEPTGYPKLIFIRKKSQEEQVEEPLYRPEENVAAELPRRGWRSHEIYGIRFWSGPDVRDVICELQSGDEDVELVMMRHSLYPIYQGILDFGGLPFHAGLVEREGKGILLAAPRNTGKSTCCRRIPNPWNALCDEETLVVQDDQKRYLAHPFPTWSNYLPKRSEKTWNVQRYVPLAAIFLLEQAEADEVIPIGQGEAAVSVYQTAMQVFYRYWHNLDHAAVGIRNKKLFKNSCKLAKSVPTFKLLVSLKGRFWEKIETVLP